MQKIGYNTKYLSYCVCYTTNVNVKYCRILQRICSNLRVHSKIRDSNLRDEIIFSNLRVYSKIRDSQQALDAVASRACSKQPANKYYNYYIWFVCCGSVNVIFNNCYVLNI